MVEIVTGTRNSSQESFSLVRKNKNGGYPKVRNFREFIIEEQKEVDVLWSQLFGNIGLQRDGKPTIHDVARVFDMYPNEIVNILDKGPSRITRTRMVRYMEMATGKVEPITGKAPPGPVYQRYLDEKRVRVRTHLTDARANSVRSSVKYSKTPRGREAQRVWYSKYYAQTRKSPAIDPKDMA